MPYKDPTQKPIYDRKYYLENGEKMRRVNRVYRRTEQGKLIHKNSELKRKFGITLAEYDEMVEEQNGVCLLCGNPEMGRRLAVDHDHETGKVRGLLCTRCNHLIGYLENTPEIILKRILEYANVQDN